MSLDSGNGSGENRKPENSDGNKSEGGEGRPKRSNSARRRRRRSGSRRPRDGEAAADDKPRSEVEEKDLGDGKKKRIFNRNRTPRDGLRSTQHQCKDRRTDHPRKTPPVALVTFSTTFAPTASISASFSVASLGCSRTVMASDFLPSPSEIAASTAATR